MQCIKKLNDFFYACLNYKLSLLNRLNHIQQEFDHMRYSDCNCAIGNMRQELCSTFTMKKSIGFSFLGILLGILTSVLLYLLFDGIFNRHLLCFHDKAAKNKKPSKGDRRAIPNYEGIAHAYRHQNCYGCHFTQAVVDMSRPTWLRY